MNKKTKRPSKKNSIRENKKHPYKTGGKNRIKNEK